METASAGFVQPRRDLPTGMVTFLFTDIEGSTVRWERDPDAMQRALRDHDRIMRDAIVAAGGVVFKTVGDAFYAAFQEPEIAIGAALAAQRFLELADFNDVDGIRVRMSLHTGTADERDGDYFGQTLNRVARILSTGHGGQILLSNATAELALSRLPRHLSLRDLGEHRLKDLTAPERVFQLVSPGLKSEFPTLKSLSVLLNNLPQQLTSLIGRSADVAAVKELVGTAALTTVIGAGGIGKTRVALQVGAEMLEAFADGAWFVDLAVLNNADLLTNTIGAVFELQESGSRSMLDILTAHLKTKKLLLILDNCEHVLHEASTVVAGILRNCSGVKIVATSREHLSIPGEALYRLPSLGVPATSDTLSVEDALTFGAIDLFVSRATSANRRFALTSDNANLVAEICRQLDGIPLAIELAAARVRVLAPKALAEKLKERFRILTGGDRTALPRQQTMRATIDWSYELLAPQEQRVFNALSVFAGSFALETAAAVASDETIDEIEVYDIATSLADKSLIHAEHCDDETTRFRLLESMQEYAAEKLLEAGNREAIAAAFAGAYANVSESIVDDYDTAAVPYGIWFARVETELENVRAALTWASQDDTDRSVGLRLASSLHRTMALFNAREAQRWVAAALERCDDATEPRLQGRLELANAFLSNTANQFAAVYQSASSAMQRFGALADARYRADAQRLAGRALICQGRVAEGEELLEAALAAHRKIGSRGAAPTLRDLALARAAAGDIDRARVLIAEALRDFEHREDLGNVAITVGTLASFEFQAGRIGVALDHAGMALELLRKLRRAHSIAWILGEMATFAIASEAFDDARLRASESLAAARAIPSPFYILHALRQLAIVTALYTGSYDGAHVERLECSAHILGFVTMRLAELETSLESIERRQMDIAQAFLVDTLGEDRFARLITEGSHFSEERAIAVAEPLCSAPSR